MDAMDSDLRAAWALYYANRPRDAMTAVGRYLRDDPESSEARCLLAFCHREVGENDLALEQAKSAVEKSPSWAYAHRTLAWMRIRRGEVTEAIHAATKAIELDPEDAWSHYTLGFAYERIDQYVAALECARRAVECAPTNSEFHDLTARCLLELGRKEEATATVKEALRLDPENKNARSTLGYLSLHEGQGKSAREEFKDALRLDPNDRRAQHGYLEATRQGHWIRYFALGATREARSRSRRIVLVLLVLGFAAFCAASDLGSETYKRVGMTVVASMFVLFVTSVFAGFLQQFVPALRTDTRALLPAEERRRLLRIVIATLIVIGILVVKQLGIGVHPLLPGIAVILALIIAKRET